MKKFTVFFMTCMLIMSYAWAQSSYEIYDNSSGSQVKVANGAVLTRGVKTTDTDYSFSLQVKNISAVMCVSWIRKYYVSILSGTTNWFCWDGCYFPNVMVCKTPININPGQIFNGFDVHYNAAGMQGQSRVKYVVYNGANRNDSTGFEVIFLSTPTGTDEYLNAGLNLKAHPNPANSVVKFTLPELTGANAAVVVKNVVGQEICRIPVSGKSKEIVWDVSTCSNGIYFYSLESSGQSRSTSKLIIQH
jgi:hypothetical protein